MRRLFTILIALATAACSHTTADQPTLDESATTEAGRISVEISSATRVEFADTQVSWSVLDKLHFATVSEDGFEVADSYISYKIDPESISESGKRAEFIPISASRTLVDGTEYMAFTGDDSYSGASQYINIFGFAATQSQDNSTDHLNDNWIMISERFSYDADDATLPLLLSHLTSMVSLTLTLESDVASETEVSHVMFRSPIDSFADDIKIMADGTICAYTACSDSYIMSIGDGDASYATISATKSYTVNFQVWWDPSIEEVEGDFTIMIKTTDGQFAQVQIPAKPLEAGTLYTRELQLPAPTTDSGADDDRATLIEIYNQAGGDEWRKATNWCSTAALDDWYGVECDEMTGRVVSLKLYYNNLTSMPSVVGDLASLRYLDISQNWFGGTIPDEVCGLEHLRELTLYSNSITGSIPAQIGNLTNLETLQLNRNSLSSSIPSQICDLESLQTLNLSYNGLEDDIPSQMGNMPSLIYLNLTANYLTGEIPESFANLPDEAYVSLLYTPYLSKSVSDAVAAHPNFAAWDL